MRSCRGASPAPARRGAGFLPAAGKAPLKRRGGCPREAAPWEKFSGLKKTAVSCSCAIFSGWEPPIRSFRVPLPQGCASFTNPACRATMGAQIRKRKGVLHERKSKKIRGPVPPGEDRNRRHGGCGGPSPGPDHQRDAGGGRRDVYRHLQRQALLQAAGGDGRDRPGRHVPGLPVPEIHREAAGRGQKLGGQGLCAEPRHERGLPR